MRHRGYVGVLLLWLVAGCTALIPASGPTPAPSSTALPSPTLSPTADVVTPERIGRAFLEAWEAGAYEEMYALLAPASRQLLSPEAFEEMHRAALRTTTTISMTLLPLEMGVEGERAWIRFKETWHTALFGPLEVDNRFDLVREDGTWWVAWQPQTLWPDLAMDRHFAVEYRVPPRANIYDRNGEGLAVPSTIVTVGVVPQAIEDEDAVLNALAQVLEKEPAQIREVYVGQPPDWYVPVGEISGEESLAYDELLSQPGIERRERLGRFYPLGGVAAHVVGWISPIPAESLEEYRRRGYRDDAWVGISGLEAWGESTLAGRNGGRLYIVNAEGEYLRGVAERQPVRGRSIYTTLDRRLQKQAEEILGERRGAMVALDVHTGGVLVMASGPHFDNNVFLRPSETQARQALLADSNRPFLNRATLGQYPSGSIFKIVTMAAGLQAAGLKADEIFHCPGYWDGLGEGNRKYCWLETGHGDITLRDALSASCNVTFYEVGKRLDALGQEILPTYGRTFGLGQKTGLEELPEAEGLMPNPRWKWETYRLPWAVGDTVNLAIGQGYLLVTPLQVARMMAAIANGGTLYRPYIVARIAEGVGIPEQVTYPQAVGRLPLSQEQLGIIQDALLGTTTRSIGTATHRFRGLPVAVAGKTGTAEPADPEAQPHSWFAGYFPADDPQVALAVVVENAGEGSTVAAPMFRQFVEAYYGLPLTPLPEPPAGPPLGD